MIGKNEPMDDSTTGCDEEFIQATDERANPSAATLGMNTLLSHTQRDSVRYMNVVRTVSCTPLTGAISLAFDPDTINDSQSIPYTSPVPCLSPL